MTFPTFYVPKRVGQLYKTDANKAITEGIASELNLASDDSRHIILILVDPQVDFIHRDGALSVPGAVEDTQRTIEWIYHHAHQITSIAASLDSHIPVQIFHPSWWIDTNDQHPDPFTPISSDDVQSSKWKPLYEYDWSIEYVKKLEVQAKKTLMIWPYHTLIGTLGHAITPALYETIVYHAAARQSTPTFLTKGMIPKTEHYSLLEPEVKVEDHPQGTLNTEFLNLVSTYDLIYIAGQAKSHCVLETVTSMMRYFKDQPEIIAKIRILEDCMSSVAHPDIDFDAIADEAFSEYAKQGLRLVTTFDDIG